LPADEGGGDLACLDVTDSIRLRLANITFAHDQKYFLAMSTLMNECSCCFWKNSPLLMVAALYLNYCT
jgi:hypothetical protein